MPKSKNPFGRILVLDDNALIRRGLERRLENWTVETVSTIRNAKALLDRDTAWTAMIVDVGLPDGNGVDLIESRIESLRHVWLMVMTRDPTRELAQRVAELGAAFVPKPFHTDAIEAWLLDVLGKKEKNTHMSPRDFVWGADDAGAPAVRQALERFAETHGLTRAEANLVALHIEGLDGPSVTKRLAIAATTYHTHSSRIRKKCGSAPAQAAVRILRAAVFGPEDTTAPARR